jgi:IS4 transposase
MVVTHHDVFILDEEVVQLYGKRWDIGVFFKTVKSYLKLTGECYSRSYDVLVAHTIVVFSRYILDRSNNAGQRMTEQRAAFSMTVVMNW